MMRTTTRSLLFNGVVFCAGVYVGALLFFGGIIDISETVAHFPITDAIIVADAPITIIANQPNVQVGDTPMDVTTKRDNTSHLEISSDPQCCVMCTTPKDLCCLKCEDISSPREHDLLMATMEGLTHHIMDKHSSSKHSFLKTRAWKYNSHIGNRPKQAVYYYDWVRSLTFGGAKARHVCEIGMNGGHSALIFLAALTGNGNSTHDGKVTMFDFLMYDYSPTAITYIDTLYPRRFVCLKGNSHVTVPKWIMKNENDKCDVFSVDGDHSFEGAKIDIWNAAKAMKKGGRVILDDMSPGGATRRSFEKAVEANVLTEPKCVENVRMMIGYNDRIDETDARDTKSSWCTATVV